MTDRESRIAEILADWRQAKNNGEPASPDEVVALHPELAGELRARFAALDVLEATFVGTDDAGVPRTVGEYRIVRELGRGGMGVVYEAEQTSMQRRIALKVLYPSITNTAEAVKRFEQEARAAGRLHHTNIVPVYTFFRLCSMMCATCSLFSLYNSVKFGVMPDCISPMKKQLGKPRVTKPWKVEVSSAHFELRARPSRPNTS